MKKVSPYYIRKELYLVESSNSKRLELEINKGLNIETLNLNNKIDQGNR